MARIPKILIIDDDLAVAEALKAALRVMGNEVEISTKADKGLIRAARENFDVVITDLHWEAQGSKRLEPKGLQLVEQLHRAKPRLPIILLTGYPAADTTIEATRRGACDYVTKPGNESEMDELVNMVRKAAAVPLQLELSAAPPVSEQPSDLSQLGPLEMREGTSGKNEIRGRSRAIQTVLKDIGRVADKPVTVLIRGETGTGKELVARALHDHSSRAERPFVIVNCVAIPEALLESELFGHEQGAFTGAASRRIGRFELANGGTIFLDEIGDMLLSTQAKLLRVLQDKIIQRVGAKESLQVDVRVIAATHRDLENAVGTKEFRADLYYRLNDAVIRLPPLRKRKEDIPELVKYFVHRHGPELGLRLSGEIGEALDKAVQSFYETSHGALTPLATAYVDAIKLLQQQPWPGNVRELKNAVRKALLLAHGQVIDAAIIRKVLDQTRFFRRTEDPAHSDEPLAAYVSELLDGAQSGKSAGLAAALTTWAEREIYSQALRLADGDQTQAAKWLGISRPTMREKLLRYKLLATAERVPEPHLV